MFEKAVRGKYRFPSNRGALTVEDLWDLSVQDLDNVFKALNRDVKKVSEESLLETHTKEETELGVKIEIVRHIVKTKLDEKKAREEAIARRAKKAEILDAIAKKQGEALGSASIEQLTKMLEDLGD
jgi:hypothetical protein